MVNRHAVILTCTAALFGNTASADWSDPTTGSSYYSYNQLGFSLAPSASVDQTVPSTIDFNGNTFVFSDEVEADGVVINLFGSREIDEKLFVVADLVSGDYDEDVSRLRIGAGLGLQKVLMDGEGSVHAGMKIYNFREEVGRFDDSDTGYGLFVGFRHVYAGDILNLGFNGIWEGFFNIERQDLGNTDGFIYDAGLRYAFDKSLSAELAFNFGDANMYGDTSLIDNFLEQFALGIKYTY